MSDATTVERMPHDPSLAPSATYRLTVTEGPDRGKSLVIDGSQPLPVYVGKGPSCALRLEDRLVSRRHLAFDLAGRRLRVTDAESTNGTIVDGLAVLDAFVRGGETIAIGETTLRVELVDGGTAVAVSPDTSFGGVVGASTSIRRLYPLLRRIAASDVSLLIEGETGTGKEVLAEAIHQEGPRASGPFVVFDCTAVAPTLVESELFGHERGAFTGAAATRRGVFEQADGGTLLIDEIGDLDPALQPKLLRALERSEVRRVGGDRSFKVDVRILSATRRDLEREVQAGRFRDDLFHRLAVTRVELPPLRKRRGDVAVFARRFAGSESIPDAVLRRWEDYAWPGNVRELRNAVARWLAIGEAAPISSSAPLPPFDGPAGAGEDVVARVVAEQRPYNQARALVIEDFEQRYVTAVLDAHGGNVVRAAAASGIARRQFQRVKARSLPPRK